MNWEAIGAVSESIGSIAVFVTLAYLAIQIRQTTHVARSSVRQAITEMAVDTASDVAENADMADLLRRLLRGETLPEVDRVRAFSRFYKTMRLYENIHYQYQSGMLSADEWKGFRSNLKDRMRWPLVGEYWSNEGRYYSRSFQALIAALQQELESDPGLKHAYMLDRAGDDA